ncbi:MAG: cupin domain-containing protein [Caldilineae bacterium]|nr:MAG: cupin domain-containing protein [Caldilineae bacterium]
MEKVFSSIGRRTKELRQQRGMTLEELAERSGCTPGFLSQVEHNKAVPSVSLLYALAEALGTSVTEFFPETIKPAKVVRHDQRQTFYFEGSSTHYALLTSKFPHSAIDGFVLEVIPARKALPTDETRAHRGEEFGYVLQGVLRLWYGDTYYDLYPGDSIHFKPTVGHRMENPGDETAVAFWLVNPAIF